MPCQPITTTCICSVYTTVGLKGWSYTAHAVVLTYSLNHCARTCYSRRIVTRCCFTQLANQVRARRGTGYFLSTNLTSFRGHVVLVRSWLPQRLRWAVPVDSEIQRRIGEISGISGLKGYQVETLEAVCLKKRGTLVCVPTGSRNSACFEGSRTVIGHVTGRERAA